MHKIAILRVDETDRNDYDNHTDSYRKIVDSITEWTDVTHEELQALKLYRDSQRYSTANRFILLEFVPDQKGFVATSVAQYLAQAQAAKKKTDAIAAKTKKEAEVRAAKAKEKADLKEKQQLEKLLKKHNLRIAAPDFPEESTTA